MLDGLITDDSAPMTDEELAGERQNDRIKAEKEKNQKKPSMSFATSFGLSLKNLFTKKGRTALTSFAGSIGIIGIALIMAVSQGMTAYIGALQEDTLSSYPLTLEAEHVNLQSLFETFLGRAQSAESHENDAVYQKSMMYEMINSLNSAETTDNDLKAFKAHLEKLLADESGTDGLREAVSGVQYTYDTELLVYTKNVDGAVMKSDTMALLREILLENFGMDMSSMTGEGSGMMSGFTAMTPSRSLWQEMLSGNDGELINPILESQYDLVYGSWPTAYNEIVLVVDENNEIDDMTLYALGLKSREDIDRGGGTRRCNKTELEIKEHKWSYEEICDMDFRVILNSDCYTLDEATGLYTDLRDSDAGLRYLYDNGTVLKVTGIIRPNEDSVSEMLTGSIGYTSALTEYIIGKAENSAAVQAQKDDPSTDIFTGLPFEENSGKLSDSEKESAFREYIASLDNNGKAQAYINIMSIPTDEELNGAVEQMLGSMTREDMNCAMLEILTAQAA